jgi:hypothetical protein
MAKGYSDYVAELETARKSGKAVEPPKRLKFGNLLGGETRAFMDAVKTQGNRSDGGMKPAGAPDAFAQAEEEERRVKALKGIKAGKMSQ